MSDTGLRTVRFVSDALPDDTFDLLDLHGLEELSRLFAFQLRLAVREPERVRGQTQALLEAPAHLVFFDDGREVRRVHGVLSELSLDLDVELDQAELTTTLVPRVWALTQRHASELALDTSLPQLLVERLTRLGLVEGDDFQLRLLGRHESREMVVQHQESDWAFLSRLCEQVGLFFAFEHASGRDVIVFGDQPDDLWSTPVVEVPYRRRGDTRGAFAVREEVRRGPSAVQLGDYNYRLPGVPLRGQHEVAGAGGWGVQRLWGEHVKTPEEAETRALVRAQQSAQERSRVSGQTTELRLTAGSVLVLVEPFGSERRVLVTRLATHVSTTVDGSGGLQATSETSFDGLPEGAVFRPERRTPWPRVTGLMHAVVDGAADGTYAELDGEGRYQVVFGHDPTTQGAMRRSRPVRMLQPHGGGDYGMHFPLRPGTEVLVGHVEGDPDRPVIVGVAPNPTIASPVGAGNATQNVLRTGSRNELVMEDMLGGERVRLATPYLSTALQLGSPEHPEQGVLVTTEGSATHLAQRGHTVVSDQHSQLVGSHTTLAEKDVLLLAGGPPPPVVPRSEVTESPAHEPPFALLARGNDSTPGSSLASSSTSPLWSEQAGQAHSRAHMLATQAADERTAKLQDVCQRAAPRRTPREHLPGQSPQLALVSQQDAALLAGGSLLMQADEVATLGALDTVRVVAERGAHVLSAGQVEVAGARGLVLSSATTIDVQAPRLLVVASADASVRSEVPGDEVAVAVAADRDVSVHVAGASCRLHAGKDIVVHAEKRCLLQSPGVTVSAGTATIDAGTVGVKAKGDVKVEAGGNVDVTAGGPMTLKGAMVTVEGSVVILRGTILLDGDVMVAGKFTTAGGLAG